MQVVSYHTDQYFGDTKITQIVGNFLSQWVLNSIPPRRVAKLTTLMLILLAGINVSTGNFIPWNNQAMAACADPAIKTTKPLSPGLEDHEESPCHGGYSRRSEWVL